MTVVGLIAASGGYVLARHPRPTPNGEDLDDDDDDDDEAEDCFEQQQQQQQQQKRWPPEPRNDMDEEKAQYALCLTSVAPERLVVTYMTVHECDFLHRPGAFDPAHLHCGSTQDPLAALTFRPPGLTDHLPHKSTRDLLEVAHVSWIGSGAGAWTAT